MRASRPLPNERSTRENLYLSSSAEPQVTVRALASHADYAACVELQRETWGQAFHDTVPASILMVSQKLGGVTAGAFSSTGQLLGFVFGMTGIENGVVVHWSDMLAVHAEAQNLGIGRQLKEFQRRAVARLGARVIYWTYDPLVARNAHLNFNVFGVRAMEYVRDMYGETGSDLHRGIGTDRFIVAWPVSDAEQAESKRANDATRDSAAFRGAPILGDAERPEGKLLGATQHARVAVPSDIAAIQESDPPLAARWRQSTRKAFESAFAQKFRVRGFLAEKQQDRGFYLLSR